MIVGVLGELALEVEVTEAQGGVEEESSSSTSNGEDIEDGDVTKEGQIISIPFEKIKFSMTCQRDKSPWKSRRVFSGLEEETAVMAEDGVQIIPPLVLVQ